MRLTIVAFLVVTTHLVTGQTQIDRSTIVKLYLNEGMFARKDHFKVSNEMNLSKKNENLSERKNDSIKYERIVYLFKEQEVKTVDELNNELKATFTYLDQDFFKQVQVRLNEELSKSRKLN